MPVYVQKEGAVFLPDDYLGDKVSWGKKDISHKEQQELLRYWAKGVYRNLEAC